MIRNEGGRCLKRKSCERIRKNRESREAPKEINQQQRNTAVVAQSHFQANISGNGCINHLPMQICESGNHRGDRFQKNFKKVESEINSWNTVASCQAELIKACRGSVFVSRVELECKPQSAAATCFCLFQLRAACLMGRTSKTRPTSETDCFWFFYHFSCFLFHFFFFAPYLRNSGEHGSRVTPDNLSRLFFFFFLSLQFK